jgi:hypothetical protein
MTLEKSQSDRLEERLIDFAARIIEFAAELPKTPAGRHISLQVLRSGKLRLRIMQRREGLRLAQFFRKTSNWQE